MTTITIPAADGTGHFAAHVSMPKATPAGVVVLIQEVFGVNQALRDTADWVADMGFIAICPDLYWRVEPGVEISDKTDSEWKKAFEVFGKFDIAKGVEGDGRMNPRISLSGDRLRVRL
jgi:carboxymethylenebutenolidase